MSKSSGRLRHCSWRARLRSGVFNLAAPVKLVYMYILPFVGKHRRMYGSENRFPQWARNVRAQLPVNRILPTCQVEVRQGGGGSVDSRR